MSRILAVGIATLDIINTVDHYPHEDEKLRALSQHIRRGGNAANTACVLTQFGHEVNLLCTLAQDASAEQVKKNLAQHGVSLEQIVEIATATTPTSYIILNQQNGSRTVVHHRDLPELEAKHFASIQVERFDWFHFEGRNLSETEKILSGLKRNIIDQSISIEIEKARDGIERLFPFADVLFFSRHYAVKQGYHSADDFLHALHASTGSAILVCSWGEHGAYACDQHGNLFHSPAFVPVEVVDTIGAGDTFNAGFISALLDGQSVESALISACKLAGRKVGQIGFARLNINQ
jgi:ketohexokinase